MRVKVDLKGGDEIRKQLQRMTVDTVQCHIREAGMAGAEIIRDDAAGRVNTGPHAEHLKDHIVIEEVRERDSRVDFAIGPDRDRWWGRLVEFGHRIIRLKGYFSKGGKRRYRILEAKGSVPAHPFLRPALDNKRQDANDRVADVLKRRLGL
ncbi:MAG TPA: hypothetical protein VD969_19560 [Symbiobacteriaceae bacterium]|nr:hypothetical protein [Symbiobacteriaceae bacterium]